MIVENKIYPNEEQLREFSEQDSDTAITMLNLLKFKDKAEYADGRESTLSGAEAYSIYGREVQAHIEKVGGTGKFAGNISRLMLGEVEELWDSVALVTYPSRKAMLSMIQNPDYQASAIHRKAGLAGQLNIEVKAGSFDGF